MLRLPAALLSGILFYFSLGLAPIWWVAWLAPIPILLASFYSPSLREATGLAYLAAAIGISSNFTYYLKTTGAWATPILLALQILVWGFFVARTRSVVRRSNSWTSVFAYPLLVTGVSVLVSLFSPHGTWGSYVYTQMDNLPTIQIASVLGPAGVTFLLSLFPSLVAVAVYKRRQIDKPWLAYGLPVVLLLSGISFGFLRLHSAPPEPSVRIGVASIDDFLGPRTAASKSIAVWEGYAKTIRSLAQSGARIVVLPEKITAASTPNEGLLSQRLSDVAAQNHVYLVAGLQLNKSAERDNISWLFGPSGGLMAEYQKQHLVPHLEGDLKPGHQDEVRQIDGQPFGLAICRDLMFTQPAKDYGKLGVSALLVPAWDFYVDAWMASSVADLRGVENGYSVVRAGRESYLNVSDRYGRVIGRKRSDFLPGASLLVDLPLGPATPTFNSRFGNWFGYLGVIGMIAVLVPRSGTRALAVKV